MLADLLCAVKVVREYNFAQIGRSTTRLITPQFADRAVPAALLRLGWKARAR